MWSHDELPTEELMAMRHGPCTCVSPRAAGTRHGFTCSPCRALRELERRAGLTTREPAMRP